MTPMQPLRLSDAAYISYIDFISRLSSGDVTIFTKLYVTNKRRHERPAKRWRNDLDKYWSDMIWQEDRPANMETAC